MAPLPSGAYDDGMPQLELIEQATRRCPHCTEPMVAAERRPEIRDYVVRFRADVSLPPQRVVPVWHCPTCKRERARFE